MHRQLTLLVSLLAIAFLVVGCGGGDEAEVQDDVTRTVPTEPVEPPPTPEEEADTDTVPPEPEPMDYASMAPQEYGIQDVFFPFDVYELSDEAMATLAESARIMKDHPDLVYVIEGHCDERGTVEYNLALGEKRAAATRDYLVSLGVPASRLRITSYGEERPFAHGSNESAWALNRRAHFARP